MGQSIHPGLIGAAAVCFATTVAFTAGVISTGNEVKKYLDGDPERPSNPTVVKLQEDRKSTLRQIDDAELEVQARRRILFSADIDLGKHLVLYSGSTALSDVSTPDRAAGLPPVKKHRLEMTKDGLVESGKRIGAQADDAASADRQSFPALEKAIKNRQDGLAEVSQRIAAQDASFQKDRQALADKLEAIKTEQDKIDKAQREARSKRQTKITQLEERIRDLLELDLRWLTEVEPVGAILAVDDSSGRVVIDLGSDDRAFAGLIFEVFTHEKGLFLSKGMLEVIEVQGGISVCRILSQADRRLHPLAKDDRIGNPTFNPKRPKTFVVAGEFERYNKADLEAFIRRSGGKVVDKLGPGVDFIVAGARSDAQQAQAREYQVLGMKEAQLLKYVQPAFSPK